MFETTIAGSLPKPAWLAETEKLWPQWKASGAELDAAKRDATLLAIKTQEDAGLDIVGDGEQARQHFVHGFLERVEGVDFEHKVKMGIRANRYEAMVPQVVAPLQLAGRVHAMEARLARAHTTKKLKFTLPGPMTIVDTVADRFYGDQVSLECYHSHVPPQLMALLDGKDLMVGVIDVASDVVETPEQVADTIGAALRFVPKHRLVPCTNCGMAPMRREVAEAKLRALAQGAALARERYR